MDNKWQQWFLWQQHLTHLLGNLHKGLPSPDQLSATWKGFVSLNGSAWGSKLSRALVTTVSFGSWCAQRFRHRVGFNQKWGMEGPRVLFFNLLMVGMHFPWSSTGFPAGLANRHLILLEIHVTQSSLPQWPSMDQNEKKKILSEHRWVGSFGTVMRESWNRALWGSLSESLSLESPSNGAVCYLNGSRTVSSR